MEATPSKKEKSAPEHRQRSLQHAGHDLGAGGGYILAPCHNIQSVTPPENIVAMYEAGYENGWR